MDLTRSCLGNLFFLLFFLAFNARVSAQTMEATGADFLPYTPKNLISDVFLGNGVEIIDIQYSGNNGAVGYFDHAGNAIGLKKGLVLTTGIARKVTGTGRDGAQDNNDVNQMYQSDPDLTQIAKGAPIRNVSKYTITFIPTDDTLRFRYVFASEEYPEFVCSEFNDVFGFFISGPGFNGNFENGAVNIAQIPGTNLPVTINNVNGGRIGVWGDPVNCSSPNGSLGFSQFFNDNQNTNFQPVFDGFTNVFQAEALVQPCQVYTIKIAIADVTDEGYDSGVFLEAKSFGTSQLLVKATTSAPDGAIVEGCDEGLLTFQLTDPASEDYVIDYTIFGTATNGLDYESIPGQLIIPKGQDSVSIVIKPLQDGIAEPIETVIIDVQKDACNRDTVIIYIRDNILPVPILRDSAVCMGEPVILDGSLPITAPAGLSFLNNQSLPLVPALVPIFSEINVNGVRPLDLTEGMIDKVCLNIQHSKPEDLDVYLVAPNGKFILLTSDNGVGGTNYFNTCFSPSATTKIEDPAQFAPYSGDFRSEGDWSDLWNVPGPANGIWQLLVIDDEFGNNGILTDWSISFKPQYTLDFGWTPTDDVSCSSCPITEVIVDEPNQFILTVTDIYGCQAEGVANLSLIAPFPTPLVECLETTYNAVTFGWPQVPGVTSIEIQVNGGNWQTFGPDLTEFSVGNLNLSETVTFGIRVNGNCEGVPAFFTCTSLNCQPPNIVVSEVIDARCPNSSDGSVRLSANGIGNLFQFELNGQNNTTGIFDNLVAGRYQVNVTDELGCTQNILVNIGQPAALAIQLVDLNNPSCFGHNDGNLEISVSGGTGPYDFQWSNNENDGSVGNLSAGFYQVTITDNNGCQTTAEYLIDEPSPLFTSASVQDVECHQRANGSVSLFPNGGTPPYSYVWAPNPGQIHDNVVDNLPGGDYAYTVLDSRGCLFSGVASVFEFDEIQLNQEVEHVNCYGEKTGSARIIPGGGAGGFTYFWSGGFPSQEINGLGAGIYYCTVTDSKGCPAIDTIEINEPSEIVFNATIDSTSCFEKNDGSASILIQGGTPQYYLQWDDGSALLSRTDLAGGFHGLSITDANGCEKYYEIEIPQPPKIEITTRNQNPLCFGENTGWIIGNALGGTGTLSFLWQNFPNLISGELRNIPAGQYRLNVSDKYGCTQEKLIELTQPDTISVAAEVTDVTCFGSRNGEIRLNEFSGGTGSLEFSWTGLGNFESNQLEILFLRAGDYLLEVKDENGCTQTRPFQVQEPEELIGEIMTEPISCQNKTDGSISINPFGGTPPYSLKMLGNPFDVNIGIRGLAPGNYHVTLLDAQKCAYEMNGIIIDEAKPLKVDLGEDKLVNFGDTVILEPEILNHFPIVSYNWTESLGQFQECPDCPKWNFLPENHTRVRLAIQDEKGCVAEDFLSIFVKKEKSILVPTAFTPNGDNNNDQLFVLGKYSGKIALFRIYDRWGELVFENGDFEINDPNEGWDGYFKNKPMNSGVFVWYAEVDFEDGTKESFKGTTTLIR